MALPKEPSVSTQTRRTIGNFSGRASAARSGYIGQMAIDAPEILRCPARLTGEALALVLADLAPSERREIAMSLSREDAALAAQRSLFVACRGPTLRGAAWGQRQPGNIAIFWPPALVPGEAARTADLLAEAVVRDLDAGGIALSQSLLADPDSELVNTLLQVGFQHSADLLYLTCESPRFPIAMPEPLEVEFEEFSDGQRDRLTRIIERTYEATMDCTALDGARKLDDVINGYRATGAFRPQNWLFVRYNGADVGVLLLADHPPAGHIELMYMGIVPEWRGRGWGRQIARYAQWLARTANARKALVAVDATNTPAVAVYRTCGFEIWGRRAVFLRFQPRMARVDHGTS